MNKKTRNVISGVLVGLASLFAIINFAEIPFQDVKNFLFSTTLFFVAIVLLALLAVSFFKFLGWINKKLFISEDAEKNNSQELSEQDNE